MPFPERPTDGQFHEGFYFDASQNLWFRLRASTEFPLTDDNKTVPTNSVVRQAIQQVIDNQSNFSFSSRSVGDIYSSMRSTPNPGELQLHGQLILVAEFSELVQKAYVGDSENDSSEYCYRCDNSDGTGRNTAGIYFKLPDARGLTAFGVGTNVDITTANGQSYSETHGYRLDQLQGHLHEFDQHTVGVFDGDSTLGSNSFYGILPSPDLDAPLVVGAPTTDSPRGPVRFGDTTQSAGFGVYWYVKALDTSSSSNTQTGDNGPSTGAAAIAIMSQPGQQYQLPSSPETGDIVDVYVGKEGTNSLITQPEAAAIVYGSASSTVGTSGRLLLKPNQALKLVRVGSIFESEEVYEISENQIDSVPGEVKTLAVSPNSEYLAISYETAPKVSVYQLSASGVYEKLNITLSSTLDVLALSWSHDSKYLAMALTHAPYLSIFELSENSFDEVSLPNRPATGQEHVDYSLSWSPTDHYLIEGHARAPYVTIYDLRDKNAITQVAITLSGLSIVYTVEIAPNGQWFAVGHTGRSSKLDLFAWNDGAPTKIPFTFSRSSEIRFMTWSPDSNSLALINNNEFQIIDWSSGAPVLSTSTTVLATPGWVLKTVAWSKQSEQVAVGLYNSDTDISQIFLYQVSVGGSTTKVQEFSISGILGQIFGAQWTPSQQYFLIAHSGGQFLSVYDAGQLIESAWQLVHLDGPEVLAGDLQ